MRIDLGYNNPGSSGGYRGYIDDVAITDQGTSPSSDPASLANPLIGTGNSGATDGQIDTFPGADTPFGMVQWSPDTSPDRTPGGGYDYSDSQLSGFSLTHMSGPGCARYGDIPILPTVGGIGGSPGLRPSRSVMFRRNKLHLGTTRRKLVPRLSPSSQSPREPDMAYSPSPRHSKPMYLSKLATAQMRTRQLQLR